MKTEANNKKTRRKFIVIAIIAVSLLFQAVVFFLIRPATNEQKPRQAETRVPNSGSPIKDSEVISVGDL